MADQQEDEFECSECGALVKNGEPVCRQCNAPLDWSGEDPGSVADPAVPISTPSLLLNPVVGGSNRILYTDHALLLATCVGGPLAGLYLVTANFRAMGDKKTARSWIITGILVTSAVFALATLLPDRIASLVPRGVFPWLVGLAGYVLLRKQQKGAIEAHLAAGGKRRSWIAVAGAAAGAFLLSVAIMYALTFMASHSGWAQEGTSAEQKQADKETQRELTALLDDLSKEDDGAAPVFCVAAPQGKYVWLSASGHVVYVSVPLQMRMPAAEMPRKIRGKADSIAGGFAYASLIPSEQKRTLIAFLDREKLTYAQTTECVIDSVQGVPDTTGWVIACTVRLDDHTRACTVIEGLFEEVMGLKAGTYSIEFEGE